MNKWQQPRQARWVTQQTGSTATRTHAKHRHRHLTYTWLARVLGLTRLPCAIRSFAHLLELFGEERAIAFHACGVSMPHPQAGARTRSQCDVAKRRVPAPSLTVRHDTSETVHCRRHKLTAGKTCACWCKAGRGCVVPAVSVTTSRRLVDGRQMRDRAFSPGNSGNRGGVRKLTHATHVHGTL